MAELIFKIGAGSGYEDGDVLCAFTRRAIRCVHAQHLCFPLFLGRLRGMDGNGIMPDGHLARDFCEATQELRLERLSRSEAQIVRVADGETIRFRSNEPFIGFDGRATAMDLDLYCRRRRNAPQFPVFGTYGQEIIYGGRTDYSTQPTNRVWLNIEAKTGRKDTDDEHRFWPLGQQDVRSHLAIPVGDDLTDEEARRVVEPQVDLLNDLLIRKRVIRANNWRGLMARLGTTAADVLDRSKAVDRRRDVEPLTDVNLLRDKIRNLAFNHRGK